MRTLDLPDGSSMPALGLGTWLSESERVDEAVQHAIEVGYRHIDCAFIYQNEAAVGRGIRAAIDAGVVTREALWVTTKLWNDSHDPQDVEPALDRSLELLGLDYVDLYLVHWPVAHRQGVLRPREPATDFLSLEQMPLERTWEAMVALRSTGKARQVGVSNHNLAQIDLITAAVGEAPSANQIELHPYLAQPELVDGLKARGIIPTAYSPLGSSGRPDGMRREDERRLLDDPVVGELAAAHDATPAQILIAWALERGTAVIPKSTNPDRIAQNFAAAALSLSDDDMRALAALDAGERYVTGEFWCPPGSPYTLESLWLR